jgi:hypothetical protein
MHHVAIHQAHHAYLVCASASVWSDIPIGDETRIQINEIEVELEERFQNQQSPLSNIEPADIYHTPTFLHLCSSNCCCVQHGHKVHGREKSYYPVLA